MLTIYLLISSLLEAAYVHDLSPFAIKFSESFGIRWYGLSYLAGFVAAYLILLQFSRKNKISLCPQQVSDFVFYAAVGAIVGGRLGYCLFYDQTLITKFSANFPFWGVLEVHHGGMASHGGILGVAIACILYARRENLLKIELFDLVALTACLGIFFGRVANFVNAELVGRPAPLSYSMAVKYPQDLHELALNTENISRLSSLAIALGYPDERVQLAAQIKDPHFFSAVIESSITAIQKGNDQVKQLVEPLLIPRYPSQLYAALLEGLLIFVILGTLRLLFSKPGLLSSAFLLLYPIGRVISEQFRMPDAQIGFQALGFTRGQWISIVMFGVGLIYSGMVLFKKEARE